jgi:hypothetical protein
LQTATKRVSKSRRARLRSSPRHGQGAWRKRVGRPRSPARRREPRRGAPTCRSLPLRGGSRLGHAVVPFGFHRQVSRRPKVSGSRVAPTHSIPLV